MCQSSFTITQRASEEAIVGKIVRYDVQDHSRLSKLVSIESQKLRLLGNLPV